VQLNGLVLLFVDASHTVIDTSSSTLIPVPQLTWPNDRATPESPSSNQSEVERTADNHRYEREARQPTRLHRTCDSTPRRVEPAIG
jgi:hypothetical protein